ncbi:MAG: alkaline phosphatase family protein, partial [Pseudomonadota bacterium]
MVHAFERILIVMMENQYRNYVLTDPFMAKLAEAGLSLTNSFGCFHPSQTNYVASLAGELCNVTNDTAPTTALTQPTLVDRMEAKGVSWKAYMEALPQEPWTKVWQAPSYPADEAPIAEYPNTNDALARYFRKHNAFASFQSIQSQQERWEKIVDEHQFWADVGNEALPQYAWFTPDIWNDGHYLYNTHIDTNPRTQLVPQMSAWLEYVFLGDTDASKIQGAAKAGVANIGLNLDVDLLLTDPAAAWAASRVPKGTLIVITFDEADYDAVGYDTNYDGPNQIYTVMLGDMITPGSTWDRPFNHYSLIRTVEENFALDSLNTNDKGAGWLRGLWGKSYGWSHPQEASCLTLGATSEAACAGGAACLVTDAKDGALQMARMTCEGWSAPAPLDLPETNGVFRLTAFDDGLMLVMQQADGGYTAAVSKDGVAWSDPAPLPAAIKGANPALLGYRDTGDNETPKAMLCWQDAQGFIHSAVFDGTAWQDPQPVGQLSDGSMALGQLGPSLFLVYKERNTQAMRVTSYNLATSLASVTRHAAPPAQAAS